MFRQTVRCLFPSATTQRVLVGDLVVSIKRAWGSKLTLRQQANKESGARRLQTALYNTNKFEVIYWDVWSQKSSLDLF